MNQFTGLPPHAQNAVVGRMLGLEILAPSLSLLEAMGHRDAGTRLVERLCWITNQALNDPDESSAVNEFLHSVLLELKDEAARLPVAVRDAVSPILARFAESVTDYCISPRDPFAELITVVAKTAAIYYEAFDIHVPDDLWQCTHPVISFLGGKISLSFSPEIHCQVSTEFGSTDTPCAQVFVKVCPRWLDADTIAALPRALLHEYISHVPQGPYHGLRDHPDANDLFAEGWMDYVAHHVYRTVLRRQGPSPLLAEFFAPAWISIYDIAGEKFFTARCALADDDSAAAARSEGAAAAHQMHDLLRRLPETTHNPDEHLYRLSFGLNTSKADGLSRQRFVAEVRHRLVFASRADLLIQALRDWASGRMKLEDLSARLLS
jgi:hypothetical protein